MRQTERERLMSEVAELLAAERVPMTEHTMENEVARYTDPEHTRRELHSVFGALPTVVGLSGQVPEPGDFVTDSLSGEPLLIMRGDDGVVRVFHNVCVHRGTQVVCDARGNRQRHTCPFHGWTYDTTGRLRAVSSAGAFPDLAQSRAGLPAIAAVERHGLIWRLPSGWDEVDLIESLAGLDDEFTSYGLDQFVVERSEIIEQPFNWKFVMDGFLETYHFKYLHQKTIGPYIRGDFGPTTEYGRNTRMVVLRTSYDEHVLGVDAPVDPLAHLAIAYNFFPNTIIVRQGPHFEVWTAHPVGGAPDKCVMRVSVLAPEPTVTDDQQRDWDRNWEILMGTVLEEDFAVSRRAQAGLETGALTHIVYGRNEPALQAFHRHLSELVPIQLSP